VKIRPRLFSVYQPFVSGFALVCWNRPKSEVGGNTIPPPLLFGFGFLPFSVSYIFDNMVLIAALG